MSGRRSTTLEAADPLVMAIADDAVRFVGAAVPSGDPGRPDLVVAGAALARCGRLISAQLATAPDRVEVLALCSRAVVETWLVGHASLVLPDDSAADLLGRRARSRRADLTTDNADAGPISLFDLARRLDLAMYGTADPPKAFQRHLASFLDEVDIGGVEGDVDWVRRYAPGGRPVGSPATSGDGEHPDHVRVSLWVTLFLAHDYFDACGRREQALTARALFDRLRAATDAFYAELRASTR